MTRVHFQEDGAYDCLRSLVLECDVLMFSLEKKYRWMLHETEHKFGTDKCKELKIWKRLRYDVDLIQSKSVAFVDDVFLSCKRKMHFIKHLVEMKMRVRAGPQRQSREENQSSNRHNLEGVISASESIRIESCKSAVVTCNQISRLFLAPVYYCFRKRYMSICHHAV